MQPHNTFLHTVSRAFLHTVLIGVDGTERIALGKIDITHRVIHLVQIVEILAVTSHRLQPTNHLLALSLRHHFSLLNPRIEFQFVRRIALIHLLELLEGKLILTNLFIELTQQEVQTCLLHTFTLLHGKLDIRDSLFVLLLPQLIVSGNRCTQSLQILRKTISACLVHQSLSIINPIELGITLRLTQSGTCNQIRSGKIQALDIGKGGSSFHVFTLSKLCLTHQEPSLPQEWVVLLLTQPNLILWSLRF